MVTAVAPDGEIREAETHQVFLHHPVHQHVFIDKAATENLKQSLHTGVIFLGMDNLAISDCTLDSNILSVFSLVDHFVVHYQVEILRKARQVINDKICRRIQDLKI